MDPSLSTTIALIVFGFVTGQFRHINPCLSRPSRQAEDRYTQHRKELRVDLGSWVLVCHEDVIRAYAHRTQDKPLWQVSGIFLLPPQVVRAKRRVIINHVIENDRTYLLCIDFSGNRKWMIPQPSAFRLAASPKVVVYSIHSGNYHKIDADTLYGKRKYWKVFARRLQDGKLLWTQSVLNVGEVCTISNNSELWTVREANPEAYYLHGKKPLYYLDLRDALTGQLRKSWELPEQQSRYGNWPTLIVSHAVKRGNTIHLFISEGEYNVQAMPLLRGVRLEAVYDQHTGRLRAVINGKSVVLRSVGTP